MLNGRWYPTLTMLDTGEVIAMSGWGSEVSFVLNVIPEKYSSSGWFHYLNPDATMPLTSVYPGGNIVPFGSRQGRIFYSYPDAQAYTFNPNAGGTTPFWETIGSPRTTPNVVGVSVLLPIKPSNSSMKFIVAGGETEDGSLDRVDIIDLNDSSPEWQTINSLRYKRHHHNAVILPDANVMIVGGNIEGATTDSVLTPELLDTDTLTWSNLPDMGVARNYHSTALLLPNGKIWTGGGRVFNGGDVEDDVERRIEIFTPLYLEDGEQPKILSSPAEIHYGQIFEINVGDVRSLDSIALIKPGSTTHGNNMDQRYIGLSF